MVGIPGPPADVPAASGIPSRERSLAYPAPRIPSPGIPTPEGTWDTHRPLNRMTDTCENIAFLQLRWEAVADVAELVGGPQVNKFEQVSGYDHLMSLAGGSPDLMSREGEEGTLYSEVQCITGNGHMGTPVD